MTDNMCHEVVTTYLKQLRLSRMARDCEPLAREAEQRGLGYLGYLQALLEGELAQRQEQQLRQRLKAAAFPYQKRLEDFDFSLVPCLSKIRLLELAQGAFLAAHDNILLIGPSGIGKTHLLLGLGRSLCLAGYRVLFLSWCHLPLRHGRGSFRCWRSRFVWLCLRPCCLLDDWMRCKSKPRASWERKRSLCWRGHGCVGPCLVRRASTCCKAFTLLGEPSPLAFWLPGIKPSVPVVLWKIGIALSGLIWPFIANSRLGCSPCSLFGIITALLLVVPMRGFLPYNGRKLSRPLTIGWLLWAIFPLLPNCSQVSH